MTATNTGHLPKLLGSFALGGAVSALGVMYWPELRGQQQQGSQKVGVQSPHLPSAGKWPCSENVFVRQGYTTSISHRTRTPNWVAEKYTWANFVKPPADQERPDRRRSEFGPDPEIPEKFQAQNTDYWNSAWSRGHLAPAAAHRVSQAELDDTFYLSGNIVPQDLSMNGCDWLRLEYLSYDVAKQLCTADSGKQLFVLSGPMWRPYPQKLDLSEGRSLTDGVNDPPVRKMPSFEVIGDNMVHVPTHMFKILALKDPSAATPVAVAAFVLPNTQIVEHKPLTDYQVPLRDVESFTGLDLSAYESDLTKDLCSLEGVKCDVKGGFRDRGCVVWSVDTIAALESFRAAVKRACEGGYLKDNFLIVKLVRAKALRLLKRLNTRSSKGDDEQVLDLVFGPEKSDEKLRNVLSEELFNLAQKEEQQKTMRPKEVLSKGG